MDLLAEVINDRRIGAGVDVAKSAQFSKKALSASQFSRFLSKHPLAAAVEPLEERQILNQQSLSASTFSQAASSIYFTF